MSGALTDGSFLNVKPELTITTASEVDFNSDYHVELVAIDHRQIKGSVGKTFSPQRAIIAHFFIEKWPTGDFYLPDGSYVAPSFEITQKQMDNSEYTVLHELGHMLSLAHAFPARIEDINGILDWTVFGTYIKEAPWDVKKLWKDAKAGNEDAIKQLSQLSMNYPELEEYAIPKGAGAKEDASKFTVGQRTQIWNASVRDQRTRLNKNKDNRK